MAALVFGPDAWAPLAEALVAFAEGDEEAELLVHSDEGEPDPMPISLFFRPSHALREADRAALSEVRGRVLDVGAGVGSISLVLQEAGVEVTAVEVIPEAAEIMVRRGVRRVWKERLQDLPPSCQFDTVLVLMNGASLAGTLDGLSPFLKVVGGLLAPGGQVLLDSTDLLGEESPSGARDWEEGEYPGEIQYQLEFRGERGAPFPQLFVDAGTLEAVARSEGWTMETVWKNPDGEYLARLSLPGPP
jgi:SAM-dependent methyltransferase